MYALGARDADEYASDVRAAGIGLATVSTLRETGFRQASAHATARLRQQGVDGFWIHLDLDVVDPRFSPLSTPEPDGCRSTSCAGSSYHCWQASLPSESK